MKMNLASGKRRSMSFTRAVCTGDFIRSGLQPPLLNVTCSHVVIEWEDMGSGGWEVGRICPIDDF